MKKLHTLFWIVILLCVAGTVVFLILSPARIPVHYNFAGEVDRIGSKYENLIWPGFAIAMGVFFQLTAGSQEKKGEQTNAKILLYAGLCSLIFFTLLGFFFMAKALRYDPEAAPRVSGDDAIRFVSIGIGVQLVVLGNIMPKMRRNAMFGLRTKWSMANDAVWQKSQRFGGIASVIAGFCMILLSPFIPGKWNLVMMTAVIVIWLILCLAASRGYYLADRANKDDPS
ncbi:MAG: SdpI family protein [Oscillospiraceae bacterium]|nr:SdpI family protein [Oscillospiraceae bacterium]